MKKVFVSGCYDLLHSGHVEFFRQAACVVKDAETFCSNHPEAIKLRIRRSGF